MAAALERQGCCAAVAPQADHPGFLFSTQLCFAAEAEGLTIVEVPVRLAADHAPKASTVRLSDVWAMGYGLLAVRRAGPPRAATARAGRP